ncbi:hypothetical protein [Streptomyces hydrogenans]|uniref:hypothetical protein n=1 Tax=Streptomyces hydrogenans TaxID=1873719 RepID=UPI00381F98C4
MSTRTGRRQRRARACGTKKRFHDISDAESAAAEFARYEPLAPPKRAYRCAFGPHWHIGRAPVPGQERRPR